MKCYVLLVILLNMNNLICSDNDDQENLTLNNLGLKGDCLNIFGSISPELRGDRLKKKLIKTYFEKIENYNKVRNGIFEFDREKTEQILEGWGVRTLIGLCFYIEKNQNNQFFFPFRVTEKSMMEFNVNYCLIEYNGDCTMPTISSSSENFKVPPRKIKQSSRRKKSLKAKLRDNRKNNNHYARSIL